MSQPMPGPQPQPYPVQGQQPPPRLKRHPLRGVLGGLLLGLGLALLIITWGKAPFGTATPYVCLACGVAAGVVLDVAGPARRRR